MTQTAVLTAGANTATNSVSGNAVNYYGPWESVLFLVSGNTTEANAQAVNRGAATLQNVYVQVPTNSRTTATTLTSRINGGAGNISITIGSGSTGVFSDSTHSDSLADGDLHNYKVAMGASAEALNISGISAQLLASGQCFKQQLAYPNASFSFQAAAGYISPAGASTSNGTEANRQMVALESATLSNLQVFVSTSGSSSPTVKARVNGSTVNQTVTLTAANTGIFEDSTHTDSVVANDLFNVITNGGNVTRTITFLGFKYLGSTTDRSPVYGGGVTVTGSAATNYWAFGHNSKSTTENDTKLPMPAGGTASGLYVRLTSNTVGTNQNWQFRLNGANGNQVAVVTASTAGIFSDSTHSDTIAAGDLVNVTTASTFNTNATVANYGFLFTATGGGGSIASAAMTATASGVGASTASSNASASGAATASGVGASTALATGSASMTATVSAVGTGLTVAAASASGSATASGVGAAVAAALAAASMVATVSGVGQSTVTATGSASMAATASGVGGALFTAVGSASMAATASATVLYSGTANMVATASGVGKSIASATGSASLTGTATGLASAKATATASAAGSVTVSGVGFSVAESAGSAPMAVTASANSVAQPSVGSAPMVATASGVGRSTARSTGSASMAATATASSAEGTLGDFLLIPTITNLGLFQAQLNTALSVIYLNMPSYGAGFPSTNGLVNGKMYYNTSNSTLYQLQNGSWVAV